MLEGEGVATIIQCTLGTPALGNSGKLRYLASRTLCYMALLSAPTVAMPVVMDIVTLLHAHKGVQRQLELLALEVQEKAERSAENSKPSPLFSTSGSTIMTMKMTSRISRARPEQCLWSVDECSQWLTVYGRFRAIPRTAQPLQR